MKKVSEFAVDVEQVSGFEFRVRFDKAAFAELTLDEPPPLGADTAPNAARILAAAIGNCLSASLVFCMKRAGVALEGTRAHVTTEIARSEAGRMRIGKVHVKLTPKLDGAARGAFEGCADKFEDFCTVTQSVRAGIQVEVEVTPDYGASEG